jgi:hypothetical protein
MRKTTLIILIISLFVGCNESIKNDRKGDLSFKDNENSDVEANYVIQNPVKSDSMNWVLFPLKLEIKDEKKSGYKNRLSYKPKNYWNVLFNNYRTNESRMLSDSIKMIINSISAQGYSSSRSGMNKVKKDVIFYSIIIDDFNENKKLDLNDPEYLFISEYGGHNLTQISPHFEHLISWTTTNKGAIIIFQTRSDTDNNKQFDDSDEIVSYIYDLEKKNLTRIFTKDFTTKVNEIFDSQWKKKK